MTNALYDNRPPGETLETEIRTALAEEEKLCHILNDQRLARNNKLNYTRCSINSLNGALGVTRIVLDSSSDVASVLTSFVDNLSSVISIHGSDPILGDLKRSLQPTDTAKRMWELVADMVENLLVQIESLKSITSSYTQCMATELDAHERIAQQSQISLDSLTQSIDALTYSMNHKRSILHPIRRIPTEVLERIFELAALDERSALQGNLIDRRTHHTSIGALYCTIPRIPTILASVCRRWRTISLDLALLWSFLRVPTLEEYLLPRPGHTRACVVGLSTFQQARSCIGTSECEIVVGPTDDWSMTNQHLCSIPTSQIFAVNIVSPLDGLDFSQFPTANVLRIIRRGTLSVVEGAVPPPSYTLPTSVLANTRELDFHHAFPAVDTPIVSVTSFSLSLNNDACYPDLGHSLADFPNLTALTLSTYIENIYYQEPITPLYHGRITTLSITDLIIPYLHLLLDEGALSLPSLTHFILLDICPSLDNKGGWDYLQSLFVNVTRFDIRAVTQQDCGSNIRELLDDMPLLQQFTLFGNAVDDGLEALQIAPIKRIGKLVVSDSKTDGSTVKSYYDALRSEPGECPDDNVNILILFVNCPFVLPRIREQLSS